MVELTRPAVQVTLMLTIIERDLARLAMSWVPRLVAQSHYRFAERLFIVDAHNSTVASPQLVAAMLRHVNAGYMDGWNVVNYSEAFIQKIASKFRWPSGYRPLTRAHAGNLVYYHMLEIVRTPYLLHYDLDLVIWSLPGNSWVAQGLTILAGNTSVLSVEPPRPGDEPQMSSGTPLCRSHEDRPTFRPTRSCGHYPATFATSRVYLMNVGRYHELVARTFVKGHACTKKKKDGKHSTHWENDISCAVCHSGLIKAQLLRARCFWNLHFPTTHWPNLTFVERVLTALVDRDLPITSENGYDAASSVAAWEARLKRAEMESEA
jgi:hypothetical protein